MEKRRVDIVVVGVVSHERICQVRGNQTKAVADRSEPQTVTESRASQGGSHRYSMQNLSSMDFMLPLAHSSRVQLIKMQDKLPTTLKNI